MPTMREVINQFMEVPVEGDRNRSPGKRPVSWGADFAEALAEHIAAEAGPTFGEAAEPDATLAEVVEAMKKYNRHKIPAVVLKMSDNGGGVVHQGDHVLFYWGPSDTPGKTAIQAIQAHTEPEPSAAELFEAVAVYAHNWQAHLQRGGKLSSDIGSSIDAVREALKGDG